MLQYDSDPSKLAALRRAVPDLKESIEIGLEDPPRPALQNLWVPEDDIPGFHDAAVAFYDLCRDFQTNKLLPAISIGLGVDSDYLVKYHTYEDSQLRLLHYPEAPAAPFARGELGRVRAHTVRVFSFDAINSSQKTSRTTEPARSCSRMMSAALRSSLPRANLSPLHRCPVPSSSTSAISSCAGRMVRIGLELKSPYQS